MLKVVLRSAANARRFSVWQPLANAQVFKMPAMSPTMTEGGIVAWKLKAGDEFASGDVLLEVETDKATIDVEALDDGIMWEILEQDGASGISVGKPIALLAEPGDDLSSLKRPDLETAEAPKEEPKKEEPKKEQPKKEEPKKEQPKKLDASASKDLVTKANPDKVLTPAVQFLLHSNHISDEDAYAKIPASGPQGRILKGDVLAYLGRIETAAISKVASYIKSKEHLDLSNIKIAPPKAAEPAKTEAPAKEVAKPTHIVSMELVLDSEEEICQQSFKHAFSLALEEAKRDAYAARFPNYALSPTSNGLFAEDIFDDLLVSPVTKDRLQVLKVDFKFSGANKPSAATAADIFDELLGAAPKAVVPSTPKSSQVSVVVDVKYDSKLADSKQFLERFQDGLREVFPWKQVVIRE